MFENSAKAFSLIAMVSFSFSLGSAKFPMSVQMGDIIFHFSALDFEYKVEENDPRLLRDK